VYIHNYDPFNPVGRFTTPCPVGGIGFSCRMSPWHDLRVNGYGLYRMHLATRDLELVYDDPRWPTWIRSRSCHAPDHPRRPSQLPKARSPSGRIYCNSVFNSICRMPARRRARCACSKGCHWAKHRGQCGVPHAVAGQRPIASGRLVLRRGAGDVPIRFQLLDDNGRMLVHETEFNSVRPGETKGCIGCHESRRHTGSMPAPRPSAMRRPNPAPKWRPDLHGANRPAV